MKKEFTALNFQKWQAIQKMNFSIHIFLFIRKLHTTLAWVENIVSPCFYNYIKGCNLAHMCFNYYIMWYDLLCSIVVKLIFLSLVDIPLFCSCFNIHSLLLWQYEMWAWEMMMKENDKEGIRIAKLSKKEQSLFSYKRI